MKRILVVFLVVLGICSVAFANGTNESSSSASEKSGYPTGPITILIPSKPGGDSDSSGRLIAKDLQSFIGATCVPVNVDAGGGVIAMKQIMDASADGQTLMNNFSYANDVVGDKYVASGYVWEDLIPIAIFAKNDTQILCVAANAPYNNAKELADYIVKNPGKVSFSVSLSKPSHFHCVAFEQACGGKFKRVEIGTGSDKTVSLLSGECNVLSSTYGIMKDYIKNGKVKVIGTLSPERSALCPDIPTIDEQGIPFSKGVGFAANYIVWAKKGTSKAVQDKLVSSIKAMTESEQFKTDCANLGFEPYFVAGADVIAHENAYKAFLENFKDIVAHDTL